MRELPDCGSWTRCDRCAVWRFRWSARSSAHAATAAAKMAELPVLLPGFATTSGTWQQAVRRHGDAAPFGGAELPLHLVVTAPDAASEAVVSDGARLVLAPEPRIREWQGVTLDVRLDTDLYARRTRTEASCNDALADLNAPRLAAFLARVRVATAASLVSVEARPTYTAQVADYGFHPTRTRFATADVFALLDRGRAVRLSNEQPDPGAFQPVDGTVDVSQAPHGHYRFVAYNVFNDGSCTSSQTDETLDRPAAHERVTDLLAHGYT